MQHWGDSPSTRPRLIALLVVAVVLHVVSAFVIFAHKPQSISTTPDPLDYRLAALNLLDHHEFSFAPPEFHAPQLLRTPAYPFLLAGTYLLDGRTGLLMILIQSIIVVGMGWLLFILLKAFNVSDSVSLLLTALYLFEPLQWLYTLLTMTETFASLGVLLLVTGAVAGKGITTVARSALFGIGAGLLILIKPSVTMWVPFLMILVLAAKGSTRERAMRGTVALMFIFVTLTPWLIRNHTLTGHYVISSSSPFNFILFAGTPETTPTSYYDVVTVASYNGHSNNVWYAYTADAYPMLVQAEKNILAHADFVQLLAKQLAYAPSVWFGYVHPVHEEAYGHEYSLFADLALGRHAQIDTALNLGDTLFWGALLLLSVIGSIVLLYRPAMRVIFFPLIVMVLITVFINFTASWARMLLPVYFAIFIACGAALDWIPAQARRIRNRLAV